MTSCSLSGPSSQFESSSSTLMQPLTAIVLILTAVVAAGRPALRLDSSCFSLASYSLCAPKLLDITSVVSTCEGDATLLTVFFTPSLTVFNGTVHFTASDEVFKTKLLTQDLDLCQVTTCPLVRGRPSNATFSGTAPPEAILIQSIRVHVTVETGSHLPLACADAIFKR